MLPPALLSCCWFSDHNCALRTLRQAAELAAAQCSEELEVADGSWLASSLLAELNTGAKRLHMRSVAHLHTLPAFLLATGLQEVSLCAGSKEESAAAADSVLSPCPITSLTCWGCCLPCSRLFGNLQHLDLERQGSCTAQTAQEDAQALLVGLSSLTQLQTLSLHLAAGAILPSHSTDLPASLHSVTLSFSLAEEFSDAGVKFTSALDIGPFTKEAGCAAAVTLEVCACFCEDPHDSLFQVRGPAALPSSDEMMIMFGCSHECTCER